MNDAGDRFFLHGDVHGITLRLYRPGEERLVDARADFAAQFASEAGRLPDGPKWTLALGGTILGVAGVEPLGEGHWGAWAYLSDLRPRHWLFARAMARAVLAYVWRGFHVTCIQAEAADSDAARRLLTHVGFRSTERPNFYVMLESC